MSDSTIAQRILATVAEFRRKGTLESSLCWPSEELERLAMFAISAKNELGRAVAPAGAELSDEELARIWRAGVPALWRVPDTMTGPLPLTCDVAAFRAALGRAAPRDAPT